MDENYKKVILEVEKRKNFEKPEEEEDDIENIEAQICAKIQQLTETDSSQLLGIISSLDYSISRIKGRNIVNNNIFSKNGLDILLFSILKNENANEIIHIYRIISNITVYSDVANSALINGVLDTIVPLLYSKETSIEVLTFSYKIISNIVLKTWLKNTQYIASFDFINLPFVTYPYQTLEFLIMCSKEAKDTVSSLNIIRGASSVKIVSDKTAFLLFWIVAYLANNNQHDIDVYSALIEGIDGYESIYGRSLFQVSLDHPDLLQPFLQSTILLLDCSPLLGKLVPMISLDFLFDVLESNADAIIIDISVMMKMIKMKIIKEDTLNDADKIRKICNLLGDSDFRIKAKALRLLVKILPSATKESSLIIYQNTHDELFDLAGNDGNESFYTLILVDGLIAKLNGLPEKDEFLGLLCDNDFYNILCDALDSCTDSNKREVLQRIKYDIDQEMQSDEEYSSF